MATDKPGATDGVRLDKKVPLFRDLEAGLDLDEMEISEVESLCMNCYRNVSKSWKFPTTTCTTYQLFHITTHLFRGLEAQLDLEELGLKVGVWIVTRKGETPTFPLILPTSHDSWVFLLLLIFNSTAAMT